MDENHQLKEQEREMLGMIRNSKDPEAAFILALEIIRQLAEQPAASAAPSTGDLPAKPEIIE